LPAHKRRKIGKETDMAVYDEYDAAALAQYLEGLGFRAIGRLLRISFGTVYQWVKKWGEEVDLPVREDAVRIVELDEIHSYVMRKKTTVGHGLLLIDMESGISLLSVATAQQPQG
jgi:hypothetical protein